MEYVNVRFVSTAIAMCEAPEGQEGEEGFTEVFEKGDEFTVRKIEDADWVNEPDEEQFSRLHLEDGIMADVCNSSFIVLD